MAERAEVLGGAASLGRIPRGGACCRAGWPLARWRWASAPRRRSPMTRTATCRTRRGGVAGCSGDGPAARRARGPPLGERCAQHPFAMRLRLSRHRRHAPLLAGLRRRVGLTLRMKPCEVTEIRLVNDLPPNRDFLPSNPSHPHQFNNTNLHFHGSHSSRGHLDNVLRRMVPASRTTSRSCCPRTTRAARSATIRITTARPTSRRRAAWPAPSSSKAISPMCAKIARARERVMLLSQVVFDAFSMIEDFGMLFSGNRGTCFLAINGQRRLIVDMRPGEGCSAGACRLAIPGQHVAGARQSTGSTSSPTTASARAGNDVGDEAAVNRAGHAPMCWSTRRVRAPTN